MKYVHTNIIARDWQKLAAFYIDTFDCKVVPPIRNQSGEWLSRGTGVKNAALQGVHLLLPGHGQSGPTLEIYQYADIDDREEVNPNSRGFGHLAFEVDDVDVVLKNILQNGGSANGEIITNIVDGVGSITFVYARDPEGNLIEIQCWEK